MTQPYSTITGASDTDDCLYISLDWHSTSSIIEDSYNELKKQELKDKKRMELKKKLLRLKGLK